MFINKITDKNWLLFQNNNLSMLQDQVLKDILTEESIIKCSFILHPHYNTQGTFCDNPWRQNIHSGSMMNCSSSTGFNALSNHNSFFIITTLNTLPKLSVRVSKSGKNTNTFTIHWWHVFNPKCLSSQNAMNPDSFFPH